MIGRKDKPKVEEQANPRGFDDFDLRLGDIMRGERATMGKSLLDVQRELKIKAPYIAAIENADPSAFETPGFIAGYVRSYARYLNMDPEWAFAAFCAEANFSTAHGMSSDASKPQRRDATPQVAAVSAAPKDPFLNPNTPFTPRGEAVLSKVEPGAIGSSLVLLALIGAIGYGGWSVLQEVQRVQLAPVNQAPGLVADVETLAPEAQVFDAPTDVAGFEAPSPDALDRLYRPEALDVPVLVARDGPIATLDPETTGALVVEPQDVTLARATPALDGPVGAPVTATVPQVTAADPDEVKLVAVRPTWVRVRAADNSVIFEKILEPGEHFVLPATEEPPTLRSGNAGALYFAVGGQTFGPAGDNGAVIKNVSLSTEDLRQNFAVADLSRDPDLAKIVNVAEAASE